MRRPVLRTVIAAFLLLLGTRLAVAEDAPPALGERIIDPAEITQRMAGNTLSGVLQETGESWVEYYCDTGRSLYEFGGINLGKWWVKSGRVCFSYEYNDYQDPICFDMYGKPDGSVAFFTRDRGGTTTFISGPPVHGDPYHLEERAVHGCALEPSV
jgi:hypothetical protein